MLARPEKLHELILQSVSGGACHFPPPPEIPPIPASIDPDDVIINLLLNHADDNNNDNNDNKYSDKHEDIKSNDQFRDPFGFEEVSYKLLATS